MTQAQILEYALETVKDKLYANRDNKHTPEALRAKWVKEKNELELRLQMEKT